MSLIIITLRQKVFYATLVRILMGMWCKFDVKPLKKDKIMTLVKYNQTRPSIFNRFFGDEFLGWENEHFSQTNTTLPSVNIKQTPNNFEVEVAAPGFKKDEFDVEVNNNVLTISSEKQEENEYNEDEKFTKREFSYLSFKRSFTLPEIVNGDKISATYKNGILKIKIPKKEEAKVKTSKKIAIK